jgi:hypothetical protein
MFTASSLILAFRYSVLLSVLCTIYVNVYEFFILYVILPPGIGPIAVGNKYIYFSLLLPETTADFTSYIIQITPFISL